jgi:hypothetical protein
MPHPADWLEAARPRRREILVRRARRGYVWQGLIQVPESYAKGVKNANALVVAIGEDCSLPEIEPGDVVFIAPGVSRRIEFEEPPEVSAAWEHTLYACRPAEVIANLGPGAGIPTELEERPGKFRKPSESRMHAEDRADETA